MFGLTLEELITLVALGVGLLLSVLVGLFLLMGLFRARSLIKREFVAYFVSPIAYVVLVVFLAVTGQLFKLTLEQLTASGPRGAEFPMQFFFSNQWFWLIYLVIPPLLTMRLFAEERSSGTLESLMTAPLLDWQVVLSKYVACYAFYALLWLPTLVYMPILIDGRWGGIRWVMTPYSLLFLGGIAGIVLALFFSLIRMGSVGRVFGVVLFTAALAAAIVGGIWHYRYDAENLLTVSSGIDPAPMFVTYLGLALSGAMFLALGLLVSSLVRSQLVSFLLALGLSLVFLAAGFWRPDLESNSLIFRVVSFFSVPVHFSQDFTRGLIDTRHVVLYATVAVLCLFLTVRSLESRRWRA